MHCCVVFDFGCLLALLLGVLFTLLVCVVYLLDVSDSSNSVVYDLFFVLMLVFVYLFVLISLALTCSWLGWAFMCWCDDMVCVYCWLIILRCFVMFAWVVFLLNMVLFTWLCCLLGVRCLCWMFGCFRFIWLLNCLFAVSGLGLGVVGLLSVWCGLVIVDWLVWILCCVDGWLAFVVSCDWIVCWVVCLLV